MASMGWEKTGKRWRVFWHVTLSDRTVDKGSKSFKDKKVALSFKKHCEKREQILKRTEVVEPVLLDKAVSHWVDSCQGYTDRTAKLYVPEVNRFMAFLPDSVAYISDLSKFHINSYLNSQMSRGLVNKTVNNTMCAIKSLCKYIHENYGVENPADGIKKLKEDPPEVYFIDQEEYETVLESCSDIVRPWIVFLANTGLRASELCGLRWRNCNLMQKTLTIVGKGRKRRTIGLNSAAVEILDHIRGGRKIKTAEAVFLGPDNQPLNRQILGRRIGKACRNAGLSGGGPHALRHYFATQLLLRGVPIIKVSILMGHSTISTTQRHYSHILSADLTGVTDVLVAG
jgi:site-specific recombinase XerD